MDVKVERSDDEVDDCSVVDPLDVENCVDSVKNEPECVQFMTVKDNDNAKGNSVSDSCEESSVTQEQPSDSSVATTEWMDVGSFRRVKTEPADPEDYICSGEVDGNSPDARLRIANIYSLTERFGESATVRVKQEPVSNFADGEVDDDSISEEYILGGRSDHDPIQCIVKGEPRHVARVDCDTNKASTSVNDEDSDDDDEEDEGRVMDEDYDGGRETYEENESDVEGEVGRNSKGEDKGSLRRVKVKRRKSLGQRKEKSKKMRLHTKGDVMNSTSKSAEPKLVLLKDKKAEKPKRRPEFNLGDGKWAITKCTSCSMNFCIPVDKEEVVSYMCNKCTESGAKNQIYKCNVCKAVFQVLSAFENHMKQTKLRCVLCGKLFCFRQSFEMHAVHCYQARFGLAKKEESKASAGNTVQAPGAVAQVTVKKEPVGNGNPLLEAETKYCTLCHLQFGTSADFEQHKSSHIQDDVLMCRICKKSFNFKSFGTMQKMFVCFGCRKQVALSTRRGPAFV